jgi:hypothetical protein
MVLSQLRHIIRDVLVWATWTILKGTPFHDQTYGDLRRVSPREFGKHVLTMALGLAGAVWLYVFMPSFLHGLYVGMLFMFAFTVLALVFSTFTLTWLLDRRLTYL